MLSQASVPWGSSGRKADKSQQRNLKHYPGRSFSHSNFDILPLECPLESIFPFLTLSLWLLIKFPEVAYPSK